MSRHFIDHTARRLFIEGLVETLSSIFQIEEEVQKGALYNELSLLKDNELVEKGEFVEKYLEESVQADRNSLLKIQILSNKMDEMEEKSTINNNLIF